MSLSARGYARHRGVSHTAVRKAIKTGRISTDSDGKIDARRADREWDSNTDPVKAKGTRSNGNGHDSSVDNTLQKAQTKRAIYKAHSAELEYQQRLGKLLDADEVTRALGQIVNEFRTAILAVPVKVRTQAPHMSVDDMKLLDDLLRHALDDLASKAEGFERQRSTTSR